MLNRYQGNSGRVQRIEEPLPQRSQARGEERRPPPPGTGSPGRPAASPQPFGAIGEKLSKLLPADIGQLETEDIILLLILYLMYRESGDSELLIIMGAMFLL